MTTPSATNRGRAIILFDGVCNLCNGAVTFVIDHDRDGYFAFAQLQSETGRDLLGDAVRLESIVLIEDGVQYSQSTAALRIARRLRNPWPLLYSLIIVPKALRDGVYSLIAANRYRLFGKTESCRLPTPDMSERFL